MDALTTIILHYESDTFSAQAAQITRDEAATMAKLLINRLCKITAMGGTMTMDGVALDELLTDLRDE